MTFDGMPAAAPQSVPTTASLLEGRRDAGENKKPKMKDPGFEKVYSRYQKSVGFNQQIDLYNTVENNENFFIGKQWEGVKANGNPTPTFNFLKRVTLFQVATVSSDNIAMQATPLSSTSRYSLGDMEKVSDVINKQFAAIFERNNVVTMTREFMRNAAVDGDGCTYTWFDPDIETGQEARGDIVTEIVENTRVHFGNPNDKNVQDQPWILINLRKPVEHVKRMARTNGFPDEGIRPDSAEEDASEYDRLTSDRVTLLVYFEKDLETGHIWAGKYTKDGQIEKFRDTGLRRYPLTWMNWDYVQDCYHGWALISQLIPNQVFVNQLFAMVMRSLQTTAFPKVIYDKTRIPHWDGGVGRAIGVNGGGDLGSIARIMDPASVSPQISQFIDTAISYTQTFMGTSDAAMGNTTPDNTSAIIALQRASNAPLEIVKQNMYQAVEDLGRIYLDMMRAYYGQRYVQVKMFTKDQMLNQPLGMTMEEQDVNTLFDFGILEEIPLSLKLDVGASSYWSEIASVQTLDNLLTQGKIALDDYLERIPDGYVSKRQELIDKIRSQEQTMQATGAGQVLDMNQEIPVEGNSGYGQLQRALKETGTV